jgi:tetratricopeptide (TPR) repeat protein
MTPEMIEEIVQQAIDRAAKFYQEGDSANAAALYRQILAVNPDQVVALQMLGLIESKQKDQHEQALARLNRALELEPDNGDVHNNLGLVYSWSDDRDAEKAEHHYRRAIELQPANIVPRSNLGIHLKGVGKVAESETTFLEALAVDPDNLALHFNYATLMGELHRWDEAVEHYKFVLERDPKNAPAHYNLSSIYLHLGQFDPGWAEYEWRWDTYPVFKKIYERFEAGPDPRPRWAGQPLAGKRIFLYSEQGIGDTIQFIRLVPELKKLGAHVIVEEHADLLPLLKGFPGIDELVQLGQPTPAFDYHQSLISLPHALRLYDLTALDGRPYLRTNYADLPDLSILDEGNWERYAGLTRVGVVWAGNPMHRNDHIRSTRLNHFRELLLPGVKLFSLQKDTRERYWPGRGVQDLAEGADGMGVVDLKDFIQDYNCTAALIDRMDLVVTVDTATAHLAGAMGKDVWLLVAWHNDWRWLADRSDTPWYPTMRIFRQPRPDDWASVFAEVRTALAERVGLTPPPSACGPRACSRCRSPRSSRSRSRASRPTTSSP